MVGNLIVSGHAECAAKVSIGGEKCAMKAELAE